MARTRGPAGIVTPITYTSASALTRGYVATGGAMDGSVTAVTALGQAPAGIVQEDVLGAGLPAAIVRHGDSPAIAGAAVPYMAEVKGDAIGRLIPAVAGDRVIGRAESTATAAGDEFLVYVYPGSK